MSPSRFLPLFLLALAASTTPIIAQTLFAPGAAIGDSGNGNVGIGTNSPGAKLEIKGGSNPFGLIVEGDGVSANARIALRRGNAGGVSATGNIDWIGNDNVVGARIGVNDDIAGSMAFKLGGGAQSYTRLFISSAGNVGIGTTAPTSKLHVVGGSDYVGTIRADGPAGGYSSFGLFENGSYKASMYWHPGVSGVGFYGASNWFFESGNVGIGTAEPAFRLDVRDGYIVTSRSAGYARAFIEGADGASYFGNLDTSDIAIGNSNNWRYLIVKNGGNVGIGTTSPSHKLAVNGTVRAKEVIVDTGWADYVFADDYELKPLSEVEAHIKEKKHLPGIPSAAEVAERGVSLGEMQSKLLAKMEEMTLYMIELKKENAELREQVKRIATAATPAP